MFQVLVYRSTQRRLPHEDHSIRAFVYMIGLRGPRVVTVRKCLKHRIA